MKNKISYENCIDYIVTQKGNNIGSREIAKYLGCSKSTVNHYYSCYLGSELYKEIAEDDKQDDEFNKTLDILCENKDYSVSNLAKRLRNAHRSNNQLRKIHREQYDSEFIFDSLVDGVKKAVSDIKEFPESVMYYNGGVNEKSNGIIEILFSDWQVGKISQHYNTEIAIKELEYYGRQVCNFIEIYNPKHIIFASLGDIVEDHLKHNIQSSVACDIGLSEQIATAIKYLWRYVIQPICAYNIPIEFVGVAGNHGSSQHKGMDIYKAGRYSYDYVIYTAIEELSKAAGYKNIAFNIPVGVFATTKIFGRNVVYEHGYFNKGTEESIRQQMVKRGQQLREHVDMMRVGDKHHSCSYDTHQIILNGSFFGVDNTGQEYAGVLGFNSIPSQVIMYHEDACIGRSTVVDYKTIQLFSQDYI